MRMKVLEIRDRATCIPALAIQMVAGGPVEDRFLWRYGFPREATFSVVLMHLSTQQASSDPYEWGGRTWPAAHMWIIENFDRLNDGDVVDVRVILGETDTPAAPEIYTDNQKENEDA